MKPIKLTVKTNSENYPIIIGSNIIKNTSSLFKNSSIKFEIEKTVCRSIRPKRKCS